MSREPRNYVLALNTGSSSLKFELFASYPAWQSRSSGSVRDIGRERSMFQIDGEEGNDSARVSTHAEAAELILDALLDGTGDRAFSVAPLVAIGHRVVRGADLYSAPVRVTPSVLSGLRSLADLAPIHIPPSLAVMDAVGERLAGVPAVAVFDTTFFRDLSDYVRRYAIPSRWLEDHGVQRYGYHGIAHEDMHNRLLQHSSKANHPKRVVTLQLGHGCSATALLDGKPIDTSMGFTPLEGLIMATRPGDIDPGVILHLQRRGLSCEQLSDALNCESGLLGLSGVSGDVRELLALEASGNRGAKLALAAFCHRIHKYLGAYAAVLGGIDALVFGGGIGENAPVLRRRICAGLAWLGLELDEAENAACMGTEQRISTLSSAIDVYVIPVQEEAAIARAALACLEARDAHCGDSSSEAAG